MDPRRVSKSTVCAYGREGSTYIGKPFLREANELINARRAKFNALEALGCSAKQAWAIAFLHHPRQYLSDDQLKSLNLD